MVSPSAIFPVTLTSTSNVELEGPGLISISSLVKPTDTACMIVHLESQLALLYQCICKYDLLSSE